LTFTHSRRECITTTERAFEILATSQKDLDCFFFPIDLRRVMGSSCLLKKGEFQCLAWRFGTEFVFVCGLSSWYIWFYGFSFCFLIFFACSLRALRAYLNGLECSKMRSLSREERSMLCLTNKEELFVCEIAMLYLQK